MAVGLRLPAYVAENGILKVAKTFARVNDFALPEQQVYFDVESFVYEIDIIGLVVLIVN